jgi:protease-4
MIPTMSPERFLLRRILTDTPMVDESAMRWLLSPIGEQAGESKWRKEMRANFKPQVDRMGDVAVIRVSGVLAQRPALEEIAWFGMEDMEALADAIDTAAKGSSAIVLDADSPGGFFTGGPELGQKVAETAKRMPVVSWTGGMMASLAYLACCQSTAIIATSSASVGSIGAYSVHVDTTKAMESMGVSVEVFKNKAGRFKAIGISGVSLTDEQRDHLQASVEKTFAVFHKAVQKGRPEVAEESMQGQTFRGSEAKKLGLVDAIGSLGYAVSYARKQAGTRQVSE